MITIKKYYTHYNSRDGNYYLNERYPNSQKEYRERHKRKMESTMQLTWPLKYLYF